jgi:pimeloyl-ACP methyl ester carboxylesterase
VEIGAIEEPRKSRSWAQHPVLWIALGVIASFFLLPTLGVVVYDLVTNGEMKPATALYSGPFVRADGTQLAYRTWGSGGSPVVLLGGAAEPSWVWHDVGPLLAREGHRVYAVDLPPFGYSERRGPYTLAHWLQLLEGFERRLHIKRPVIVGHSLGAGVAAAEGLARPRDVAGVVLLDGDALRFGGGHGWIADLLVYPYYTALYRFATGTDPLVEAILSGAWGPNAPQFTHATLAEFERPFRVNGTDDALKQMAAGGIPGLTLSQLARLRVPRAVLWGRGDHVDSLASGRASAGALRTPFVTIPGAGHLSMLARPGAVAHRILAFIQSSR